jgi:hypothetical protein
MRMASFAAGALSCLMLAGCSTTGADEEKGPRGMLAYFIRVEASSPGIRIETNHVFAGVTPLVVKVFGDPGGTFHNFGSSEFSIVALPSSTKEFPQLQRFLTGTPSAPGSSIPGLLFFDMNRKSGGFSLDTFPEK